ncbi:UNVERIFIED_CONTAM: hypothetical protein H355_008177 [Colinus virginianus]|nr:hypothetical protein H355_008177 [Colinus virginianus]
MAGLRYPQQGGYCRAAAAMNLLLGVFHVLLPCFRPGEAQGQAIEPIPGVVELWQAEEGELLLPAQADSEEDVEEHPQEQRLEALRRSLINSDYKRPVAPDRTVSSFEWSALFKKSSVFTCRVNQAAFSFSAKMPPNGKALHFHPSVLHFGMQLLGLPRAKMLHAYNPSRDREVVVNSVFTATGQFHVSPVHSRVFGVGTLTSSPEEPRIPLANAYLLLPHIQSIQTSQTLAETMNTSLLNVHLECSLPSDAHQQVKSCCSMSDDPMLLEMSLTVRMENAQQDFVEQRQYLLENLFVVYVAMEKTKTSGDFIVDMYILHSGNGRVHIQSLCENHYGCVFVLLADGVFSCVSVIFQAAFCDSARPYSDDKKNSVVEDTTALQACLSCPVMEGYFDVDPSAAMFHIEPHHNISGFWSIWFTNNFEFSIELNEVYVSRETKNILKILNFAEPLTLSPGCWNVFSLKLDVNDTVTTLLSRICLSTNVGVIFEIPLQIHLTVSKQDLHFEAIAHCDIHCYLGKSDSANLLWQRSLTLDRSAWDVDSELASELYERWQKIRHGEACRFGINVQAINFTTTEFRLMDECSHRNAHQEDLISKKCSYDLLRLNLQPLETRKIGVIFTPVDYKRVASVILIRNNLTVLDVVNVEGYGARELLKVGGRLPGAGGSLRFKVPEATLMDCRRQLKDSKQILSITKNFKVENIGPLPITISSMKINGYSCQGYGFEVLDCQEFFLAQNSSREISIVFTPDFTSSWVIRELTLVTAADLEFHFTLNVTLPHHLLPLCADVVPGPSWEESFWRLTVLFVRGSCKTFMDSYSPSDKGKGKGFVSLGTSSRSQNAAKRSPATYSHSQKKHKCSVYYSKQKPNTAAGNAIITTDEKQNQVVENQVSASKEDVCTDVVSENWVTLKYVNGINVNKNLTLPENFLGKEEGALKNTVLIKSTSECSLKEDLQTCMFPKETNLKASENLAELKEQDFCSVKMSKKLPESHLSSSPQQQPELREMSRKNSGNDQKVPFRNETENCETLKKQINIKPSTEKKINKGPKEEILCCTKEEITSSEQEDAFRRKKPQEKKEGNVPNMSWNRNRTSRKNKKKNVNISSRVPEQSELKHLCNEYERPDLRVNIGIRAWCPQSDGENCKADQKPGNLSMQGETGENISQNDFPSETPITLNLSHNICNTSFIDWNATCDSQFSSMYCPLEMNEYGAFPEENMNYPSGFPGTAAMQNTAFIDQSCPSTWNAPPSMPPTWEPASYVNSAPYLSSTRSLSPMSGLFGSIWAPQSDVYESCCPVSATAQNSTHVENQTVMCKQEYYPRFNPFRAYMNLDIWTTAANRNANFPLSRDSGYCGNV